MTVILPPLKTLPLAHPHRRRAEATLGLGRFRRIAWRPEGEIGDCHGTVLRALLRDGGQPVLGWQIHVWPGLFVEALAHWAWQSPDGHLIDLSRKYPGDTADCTTFAIGRDGQGRHSRYHLLKDAPEVHVLIDAGRRQADNRARIEMAVRGRLSGPVMRLVDHADAREREILRQDEAFMAVAIRACLSVSGYASQQLNSALTR